MTERRKVAHQLVDELAADFDEALRSVLLFGSVARGEAIEGVSNVNVLVLLDDVNTTRLRAALPHAQRWREEGAVPLLLSAAEWREATDVFAIELADMHDAHEMLHGPDPIADHVVDPGAMRLQAERELRGKLLQLRSGLLASASDPEQLGGLLIAALPSFATYLRAALRLADRPVPGDMRAVITSGTQLVGADDAGLLAAHDARAGGRKLRVSLTDPIVEAYHTAAEQTAAFVNSIQE